MWIFFILTILLIIIICSTIKIEIDEKMINSYKDLKKLSFIISMNLFNKIKLISLRIAANKFQKNNKILKGKTRNIVRILKYISNTNKIKLENLKLNLEIGIEDAALTSYIVAAISTIISIIIANQANNFSKSKYQYEIMPLYINKNVFNLSINCIISIKVVHIIYMIYVLMRKDDEEYGRTSNRRTYDNSHEQYKRYGRCKYNYR